MEVSPWGSWSLTLLSLSQQGELFLAREFSPGTQLGQPGEWNDVGKVKLFFLSFLCDYSQCFFPLRC